MFDYILVGGGAAGLSLALTLARRSLHSASPLIIDARGEQPTGHGWGFWTRDATAVDSVVERTWHRVSFATSSAERVLDADVYRYAYLSGAALWALARREAPNVQWLQGRVTRIVDADDAAHVVLSDGRCFAGRWVFDSRPQSPVERDTLWQTFAGWHIQTPRSAFDADVAVLMDFRTPQCGAVRFVYVLPFSTHEALVEHVSCGPQRVPLAEHEASLRAYIGDVLGIDAFTVTHREAGSTPLVGQFARRRASAHVLRIGSPGGRVKPSTGYAFARILRDSEAIADSLERTGQPFDIPGDSVRHRRYDGVLLDLIRRDPERVPAVLESLFSANPLDRVFRFLDETSTYLDDVRLAAGLPAWFWLRAITPPWSMPWLRLQVSS